VALPNRFALDWRRLMRWCLLGTAIMFLWLMAPVVKCTFTAFQAHRSVRSIRISLRRRPTPSAWSRSGFVQVTTAAKVCYSRLRSSDRRAGREPAARVRGRDVITWASPLGSRRRKTSTAELGAARCGDQANVHYARGRPSLRSLTPFGVTWTSSRVEDLTHLARQRVGRDRLLEEGDSESRTP